MFLLKWLVSDTFLVLHITITMFSLLCTFSLLELEDEWKNMVNVHAIDILHARLDISLVPECK